MGEVSAGIGRSSNATVLIARRTKLGFCVMSVSVSLWATGRDGGKDREGTPGRLTPFYGVVYLLEKLLAWWVWICVDLHRSVDVRGRMGEIYLYKPRLKS